LAYGIKKKLNTNGCSFCHLSLILSLHYLVKCKSHAIIKHAVGEWHQRLPLTLALEKNILSACCNNDNMT